METTELAVKKDQIDSLVGQTNEAITANQTSVTRAKTAGFALIDEIEQKGMSDAMDERCNNLLVKIKKTSVIMLEKRKPVTQLFDQLKKVFTGYENELDPKTNGSVYNQIQAFRDNYAAEKVEKARKEEAERQRLLKIENEKADVRSKVAIALNDYFEDHLREKVNYLVDVFNSAIIEDFKSVQHFVENFPVDYSREHFNRFKKSVSVIYLTHETITTIVDETKTEDQFKIFAEIFWAKIDDLKLNLVEKLPGKLLELQQMAEAKKKDKEEFDRLQKQKVEREAAEKIQQQKEAEERQKETALKVEQEKSTTQMQNMFDATPTETVSTSQVRSGYEITVTHQKGWLEIFNFWWIKTGNDLPLDEIGRKSLDQMKTFCQNYTAKEGEKITSPYVKYKETFKAVAKA